ncbi:MAG: SIMPL domain-containing protein [Candidatus Nitrosocaldus sp.]
MKGNTSIYVTVAAAVLAIVVATYLISSSSTVVASPNNMMRYQRSSSSNNDSTITTTTQEMSSPQRSLELQKSNEGTTTNVDVREKVLMVNGFGYISVMPDTVSINIGVDTLAETSKDAVAKNSEIVTSVIDALKALGLEEKKEVRTSYFSIYPQYQYPQDGTPPTIVGYQASNTINVLTKKVENAAEIIDKAVSAGANRIDGPWYSISLDAQKQYRDQVIEMAMKDAEDNAKVILALQDLSIKGIKSIAINFNGQPIAFFGLREAIGGSLYGGPGSILALPPAYYPPIMPGEQQITATVTIVYEVGEQ